MLLVNMPFLGIATIVCPLLSTPPETGVGFLRLITSSHSSKLSEEICFCPCEEVSENSPLRGSSKVKFGLNLSLGSGSSSRPSSAHDRYRKTFSRFSCSNKK